jgi:hypothetical protein
MIFSPRVAFDGPFFGFDEEITDDIFYNTKIQRTENIAFMYFFRRSVNNSQCN